MHNHFFDPCMLKARELIDRGDVGDIISMESHYGLNTRIDAFRKYPSPNQLPWLYSLPAGVFHDFLPHPLYVMLPFLGKIEGIDVQEKSFGELPRNLSDELHILVRGDKAIGHATISFAAKPHQHYLRIFGTRMMVHVDFNSMTTTLHPVSSLPKAAQRAISNFSTSWQLAYGTTANVWKFARKKLRPYQGMETLIHQFYDAVRGKGEVPVPQEDALKVIDTIDQITERLKGIRLDFQPIIPQKLPADHAKKRTVLVTGATGFLGKRTVEILLERGYIVRALVRKLSRTKFLEGLGAEIFFGDVAAKDSLLPAFEGVDVVIHAAADTTGDPAQGEISTIQGTRNILDVCREAAIKKLVYISSCSVYGVAEHRKGDLLTEDASFEPCPEKRGPYSRAKSEAEKLVLDAMREGTFPVVCLRPGTIYGPGGPVYTPMMGFSLAGRLFVNIGKGDFVLPLVYIDNVVEAITLAIENDSGNNQTYNVVDPYNISKENYMKSLVRRLYPRAWSTYIPLWLLYGAVLSQQLIFSLLRRKPFLTTYRLMSSQKNVVYDSSKIERELGWKAGMKPEEAFERIIEAAVAKR